MTQLISIIIIIISVAILVWIDRSVKSGRLKPKNTYSYKSVVMSYKVPSLILFTICSAIYYFSKSFEIAVTFSIFFVACLIYSLLIRLHSEYLIKCRGGKKEIEE